MAEADPHRSESARILATNPVAGTETLERKNMWKRRAAFVSVPLLLVAAAITWFILSQNIVNTDNAYVKQDIVSVGSDVAGRIVRVHVRENQQVKQGDLLFEVDPERYRVSLEQANAEIAKAEVDLHQLRTDYSGTSVDVAKAKTDISFAQAEYDRQRALVSQGFTTRVRLEAAQHALEVAQAELQTALSDAAKARSALATGRQVPGINPDLALAQAKRDKALLDLNLTQIRAPISGRVSQTARLQVGQMMIAGLPALSIVANDRSWVEANFKESELAKIRPGQRATLEFDAYPDIKLKGHVESIGGGTGSEFSVLPAQNANGNWVKISQRVPVQIAIDEKSKRILIAGLSAQAKVYVED